MDDDEGETEPETTTTTPPENTDKLLDRLGKMAGQVSTLTQENADLIAERNKYQIRAHSLEKITQAHSIDIDSALTPAALSVLEVKDGAVTGEFAYTAPSIGTKQSPPPSNGTASGTSALTRESIEKMSDDEINENWDQISSFLSKSGASA